MSILFVLCLWILAAGAATRFIDEISRDRIRFIPLVWKMVELLALAWIFNHLS